MEKMMQNMMKRFPMVIGMGFMIVGIALIIGAVNAGRAADYYSVEKTVRDSSLQLAQLLAGIEATVIWLPYFKFLGVGMILAGITMALGVIAMRLQRLGEEVMSSVPADSRIALPPRPRTAMAMRAWMMMGMLILVIGFIVSLSVAGTAASVFSNPITAIDAAAPGSELLTGLAEVHTAEGWLEAFKFVGVAFLFMGIINGLVTILFALNFQREALPQVIERTRTPSGAAPVPAGD